MPGWLPPSTSTAWCATISCDEETTLHVSKGERKAQSHEIAKRVRPRVAAIASKYGARVAVAEVPPGPPVLQTLVAEVYGPTEENRLALAQKVIQTFHNTKGVVDTDWYIEAEDRKSVG